MSGLTSHERARITARRERAERRAERRRPQDLSDMLARDVPCSRCESGIVPVILASMVGGPECVCPGCAEVLQRAKAPRPEDVRAEAFARRLRRANLERQQRIVAALGLTADEPDPEVVQGARWRSTMAACTTFRARHCRDGRPTGALMVLAGPSGVGKSTCAARLSYDTHGRFLPREEWTRLRRYDDTSELDWLLQHGGVVVLDEVCLMAGAGSVDNRHDIAVVDTLVKGRHARGLNTVLTTNATYQEFVDHYGVTAKAIWRRSMDLAGEVVGAGWVDCTPTTAGGGER